MSPAKRGRPRAWLGIGISLLCLGLLIWIVGPNQLSETLSSATPSVLAWGLALTPVVITLRFWRWYMLARVEVADLAAGECLRSYLAGLSLAVLTPLSAGELARGALLTRGDQARFAGLTLLDKVFDLSWVGLLGLIGVGLVFEEVRVMAWGATAVIPLCWAIAWRLTRRAEGESHGIWRRFLFVLTRVPPRRLLAVAALAAATQLVYVGQGWVVLRAFSEGAGVEAAALLPVVTLSTIVPAFLGGLGVRELTAYWLLPAAGIDAVAAAEAAFGQFAIVMIPPAVVGAFFLAGLTQLSEAPSPQSEAPS